MKRHPQRAPHVRSEKNSTGPTSAWARIGCSLPLSLDACTNSCTCRPMVSSPPSTASLKSWSWLPPRAHLSCLAARRPKVIPRPRGSLRNEHTQRVLSRRAFPDHRHPGRGRESAPGSLTSLSTVPRPVGVQESARLQDGTGTRQGRREPCTGRRTLSVTQRKVRSPPAAGFGDGAGGANPKSVADEVE